MSQAELLSQISYLQADLTRLSQRLGNGQTEDAGNASTFGKRVDEAKQLIKQLEAYKSMSMKDQEEDNDDTVVIEKNDKGDVSFPERVKLVCLSLTIAFFRSLPMSSFIPQKQPRCTKKAKSPISMKESQNWKVLSAQVQETIWYAHMQFQFRWSLILYQVGTHWKFLKAIKYGSLIGSRVPL